jgi:hypothetical protein
MSRVMTPAHRSSSRTEGVVALGLYGPEGLQWAGGGNAAGVQVFVFLPGTTTKAVLYLDDEAEFSASNPVTSDQSGRIAFYAEQGAYDLVINSTRFAINISDNIGEPFPRLNQLADVTVANPLDGQALVWDTGTGRWRNETIAGGGPGAVESVNGETGEVVLTASDVGAAPIAHTHATSDVTGLTAFVNALVTSGLAGLIDAAPASLDTLNELAAALGDDPNFAATMVTQINARGVQGFATTGRHQIAFKGDTTSSWVLSPVEYRLSVSAVAGNILRWSPQLQINAGGADAELDVVSVVGGAAARYFSTGTTTPGPNGHGRLYLGTNYGRSLPAIEWPVTADDIDGGVVMLALRYRDSGSGVTIGSTLYPGHIDLVNLGG